MGSNGYKRQQGSVAVEFSIGVFFFFFMCFAWIELSYVSYVSALTDFAVSSIARATKSYDHAEWHVTNDDYYRRRTEALMKDGDSLWANFLDVDKIRVERKYYKDISPILEPCVNKDEDKENQESDLNCLPEGERYPMGAPIAIYSVQYEYTPLILDIFSGLEFKREVIAIQENERCAFYVSGNLSCG